MKPRLATEPGLLPYRWYRLMQAEARNGRHTKWWRVWPHTPRTARMKAINHAANRLSRITGVI